VGCESDEYYAGVDLSGQGADLESQLQTRLASTHILVPYSKLWEVLEFVDADPTNSSNVICVYAQHGVPAMHGMSGNLRAWNREHLWPKIFGVGSDETGPDFSDLHAIRPSLIEVNEARGSTAFDNALRDWPHAAPAHSMAAKDTAVSSSSFLPPAAVRGDIARAMFYMSVRYDGREAGTKNLTLTSCPCPSRGALGNLSALLQWHFEDPVDAAELARNAQVCGHQGNRNPFVDHPSLVSRLWSDGDTDAMCDEIISFGLMSCMRSDSTEVSQTPAVVMAWAATGFCFIAAILSLLVLLHISATGRDFSQMASRFPWRLAWAHRNALTPTVVAPDPWEEDSKELEFTEINVQDFEDTDDVPLRSFLDWLKENPGFGFKGGIARTFAKKVFGVPADAAWMVAEMKRFNDIDLIIFVEGAVTLEEQEQMIDNVCEKPVANIVVVPQDVEIASYDIASYFQSRDITLNQVLVYCGDGGRLWLVSAKIARLHSLGGIASPTRTSAAGSLHVNYKLDRLGRPVQNIKHIVRALTAWVKGRSQDVLFDEATLQHWKRNPFPPGYVYYIMEQVKAEDFERVYLKLVSLGFVERHNKGCNFWWGELLQLLNNCAARNGGRFDMRRTELSTDEVLIWKSRKISAMTEQMLKETEETFDTGNRVMDYSWVYPYRVSSNTECSGPGVHCGENLRERRQSEDLAQSERVSQIAVSVGRVNKKLAVDRDCREVAVANQWVRMQEAAKLVQGIKRDHWVGASRVQRFRSNTRELVNGDIIQNESTPMTVRFRPACPWSSQDRLWADQMIHKYDDAVVTNMLEVEDTGANSRGKSTELVIQQKLSLMATMRFFTSATLSVPWQKVLGILGLLLLAVSAMMRPLAFLIDRSAGMVLIVSAITWFSAIMAEYCLLHLGRRAIQFINTTLMWSVLQAAAVQLTPRNFSETWSRLVGDSKVLSTTLTSCTTLALHLATGIAAATLILVTARKGGDTVVWETCLVFICLNTGAVVVVAVVIGFDMRFRSRAVRSAMGYVYGLTFRMLRNLPLLQQTALSGHQLVFGEALHVALVRRTHMDIVFAVVTQFLHAIQFVSVALAVPALQGSPDSVFLIVLVPVAASAFTGFGVEFLRFMGQVGSLERLFLLSVQADKGRIRFGHATELVIGEGVPTLHIVGLRVRYGNVANGQGGITLEHFDAPRGQLSVLRLARGGGSSTLVRLLFRQLPTVHHIKLCGTCVSELSADTLRSAIVCADHCDSVEVFNSGGGGFTLIDYVMLMENPEVDSSIVLGILDELGILEWSHKLNQGCESDSWHTQMSKHQAFTVHLARLLVCCQASSDVCLAVVVDPLRHCCSSDHARKFAALLKSQFKFALSRGIAVVVVHQTHVYGDPWSVDGGGGNENDEISLHLNPDKVDGLIATASGSAYI